MWNEVMSDRRVEFHSASDPMTEIERLAGMIFAADPPHPVPQEQVLLPHTQLQPKSAKAIMDSTNPLATLFSDVSVGKVIGRANREEDSLGDRPTTGRKTEVKSADSSSVKTQQPLPSFSPLQPSGLSLPSNPVNAPTTPLALPKCASTSTGPKTEATASTPRKIPLSAVPAKIDELQLGLSTRATKKTSLFPGLMAIPRELTDDEITQARKGVPTAPELPEISMQVVVELETEMEALCWSEHVHKLPANMKGDPRLVEYPRRAKQLSQSKELSQKTKIDARMKDLWARITGAND